MIQSTDGRGNATTYAYDALNRKTGMTDALGNHTTYVYDAAGNLTQEQDPTPAGQTARTTNLCLRFDGSAHDRDRPPGQHDGGRAMMPMGTWSP